MSVRKVYDLLLDGDTVFRGSYASVMNALSAVEAVLVKLDARDHFITVAFDPISFRKGGDS